MCSLRQEDLSKDYEHIGEQGDFTEVDTVVCTKPGRQGGDI